MHVTALADRLSIELLGRFRLRVDGRDRELPAGDQRLLAVLAQSRVQPRAALAGALWPDVPEPRAAASLRTALWRLGRVAGALVLPDRHCVRLGDEVVVDVERLRGAIATVLDCRRFDVLPDLLALSGELLPGWYDDPTSRERDQLRQVWLGAVEYAGELALDAGCPAVALRAALAVAVADPPRESAHRLIIRVHLAAGNVVAARRQAQLCRRTLAGYGLPPSPALTTLLPTPALTGR